MTTQSAGIGGRRIATLDIVRGVAVMGILAMNIVAFAMPEQAYFNPLAYGTGNAADLAAYALSFVFVEGKMRGLFSLLFGASMLLVVQLASAKGESPARVTFSRQLWLLVFGMLHFYLIWWGDILIHYALVGMLAWWFRARPASSLVRWAIVLISVQFLVLAAAAWMTTMLAAAVSEPSPDPRLVETWRQVTAMIAIPSSAELEADLALYRGPWPAILDHQLTDNLLLPFIFTAAMGAETLAFMLLGMAGLKSGFLTGEWDKARYRRLAAICLAVAVPAFALLAAWMFADGFDVPTLSSVSAATVPFRVLMVLAYAALIILSARRGGWLADRIAAAGRAAFTNYLGTSIVMTGLFYGWGLGLYGSLGRAELWLVVIAMWVVMLAWSKPWLDRFAYGPFEWAWRSLARFKPQPMRKAAGAGAVAAGA